MTDAESTAMAEDERDAFLGIGGTGVMSFSGTDTEYPHAVPVSYGYDSENTTFYLRLAVDSDSDKGEIDDQPVTLVVYGQTDDRWQSVIAKGRPERTTEPSIATESLEGLREVHIPLVDIFGRPASEVPFEFYRLVPEEISSRKETTTAT